MSNKDTRNEIEAIVRGIMQEKAEPTREDLLTIPVGVSNRHVHLCREDMDILFGKGSEMTELKELSQKGFYAAKETVTVAGPKGSISKVRLLGPLRSNTQIELLASDRYTLGILPPVKESGTQSISPSITLVGPKGTIVNCMGGMVAARHIHMKTEEAAILGLRDGDYVKVRTLGERELVFSKVKIRTGPFNTELHLDSDEANAAGISTGDKVRIVL